MTRSSNSLAPRCVDPDAWDEAYAPTLAFLLELKERNARAPRLQIVEGGLVVGSTFFEDAGCSRAETGEERAAKRRRAEARAGAARALREEHGIRLDEVIETYRGLGRDGRGRTTRDEIGALAAGRRFCATMNASAPLRRVCAASVLLACCDDATRQQPPDDDDDDDDAKPVERGRPPNSASDPRGADEDRLAASDSDSDSSSAQPSPAGGARALVDDSGGRGRGARVSFGEFCRGVLAAARTMRTARDTADTPHGGARAVACDH